MAGAQLAAEPARAARGEPPVRRLLGYAADMRAQGRCNGTPGGVDEDDEEGEMTVPDADPRELGPRLSEVPVPTDVAVAIDLPCPGCVHVEVCRIRPELETRLQRLTVSTPRLDPAITLGLEAKAECSLYRPERPQKRGGGASPDQPGGPGAHA